MNKIAITGRLSRDVELRTFDSGKSLATFAIAHNPKPDKPPYFFECEAWGETGERLKTAKKGEEISILGSLSQQTWTDKATGQSRSKVVITVWDAAAFSKPKGAIQNHTPRTGPGPSPRYPDAPVPRVVEQVEFEMPF